VEENLGEEAAKQAAEALLNSEFAGERLESNLSRELRIVLPKMRYPKDRAPDCK